MKNAVSKIQFTCLPSTVRFARSEHPRGIDKLKFACAKGERESNQLLVYTEDKCRLRIDPLSDGKNILTAECFKAYVMKYTRTVTGSPGSVFYPPDEYPDALVPLELFEASGETADGCTAMWITVDIPLETPYGNYCGEFTLQTSGYSVKVPVEVKVFDCAVPQKTMPTSFGIWGDCIDSGFPVSEETAKVYADFFMDYRINLRWHFTDREMPNADLFADYADKYFDHPRLTGICLPDAQGKDERIKIDAFPQYIKALARRSRPGRNLLGKAYAYFYDEPEGNNSIVHIEEVLDYYREMLVKTLSEIEADTSEEYKAFKLIENYADYILHFRHLGTMWLDCPSAKLLDRTDMWCPPLIAYDSEIMRTNAVALAEKIDAELWWYGCIGPHYPFPTYQITDKLISSRLLSWMQKAYGIDGNLYWCAAGLRKGSDCFYEFPSSADGHFSGDGFLVYPGSRYGSIAPIPSIRLMSILDGIEDHALLTRLEQKFCEYSHTYEGFCAERAMEVFMLGLFDGISCFSDTTVFATRREKLLSLLSDGCGYALGDIRVKGKAATFSLYAAPGAKITACGETVEASVTPMTVTVPIQSGIAEVKVSVEFNGKRFDYTEVLYSGIDLMHDMHVRNDCLDVFGPSDAVTGLRYPTDVRLGLDRAVQFDLTAGSDGHAFINVNLSEVGNDADAERVEIKLYNMESRSLTVFLKLVSGDEKYELEAKEFFANRTMLLTAEIREFRRRYPNIPFEKLEIDIRNTYPADRADGMRILLGGMKLIRLNGKGVNK